jgi:hypothetical protein
MYPLDRTTTFNIIGNFTVEDSHMGLWMCAAALHAQYTEFEGSRWTLAMKG